MPKVTVTDPLLTQKTFADLRAGMMFIFTGITASRMVYMKVLQSVFDPHKSEYCDRRGYVALATGTYCPVRSTSPEWNYSVFPVKEVQLSATPGETI